MSLLPSTLLCLLGGDRLRGPVGHRAEHPGGLPPGLPGARPGQRLLREPLRRHRHDHQQPAAAGKRPPGRPIVCILYFVVFFDILLINKRLTLKHSTCTSYTIPYYTIVDADDLLRGDRDLLQLRSGVCDQVPVGHLARHPGQLPPHHHLVRSYYCTVLVSGFGEYADIDMLCLCVLLIYCIFCFLVIGAWIWRSSTFCCPALVSTVVTLMCAF